MKELILFDLDGTLTDSGPGIMNCVKYAFDQYGFKDYDADLLRTFVGPPLQYRFKEVLGVDDETAKELVKSYRAYYMEHGLWDNSVYEGIPEVLTLLKCSGKKLGVASSKPHHMVVSVLERFELKEYFDVVHGGKAEGKASEKSAVLKEAIASAGYADKLDQVLLIGDTKYDVLGAKQIGIDCVGVAYGYGTQEELKESGAVKICKTPGDLVYLVL